MGTVLQAEHVQIMVYSDGRCQDVLRRCVTEDLKPLSVIIACLLVVMLTFSSEVSLIWTGPKKIECLPTSK
ncbi:hypothetical protein FIBSPDRAFT_871089 [Athelia psychrophila]|uniref:Uncharacterized protein n=1 Tax=Athelia psychrophila TaxID=1759441 RepID=A0A166AKD9_9AGAM|nr:hypothetical protein FIBSPDRAFT_871089 [Fibularhizoctonia sp. CBS 109695]